MKKIIILLFACVFSLGVSAATLDNDYIRVEESVLTFTTSKQIRQMSVYTLLGGKVLEQRSDSNEIVISDLPNGFYLLKVFTDKGILTYKFMKN